MMQIEFNKLSGDWCCFIPETISHYYFIKSKREAKKFVNNVNAAFERGELKIVDNRVIKVEVDK